MRNSQAGRAGWRPPGRNFPRWPTTSSHASASRNRPMSDDGEADDHPKVGYRTPPAAHRFRRGQSGNVLGRPPKSSTKAADRSTLSQAYIAEAQRMLQITEPGKVSQAKTIEVALRRQGMAAAGGDLKAQKEFVAGVRFAE